MSRRTDRFQKYDEATRIGMLEDDVDEIEEKSRRRFAVATSISVMFGTAMLGGLAELVVAVLRGGH